MTITYFTMYVLIPLAATLICTTVNFEVKNDSRIPTMEDNSKYIFITNFVLLWIVIMLVLGIHRYFIYSTLNI